MKKIFFLVLTLFIILNVHSQSNTVSKNISANLSLESTYTTYSMASDSFDKNLKSSYDNSMMYALVAGGSKGIGYAIAEALAKRKYNLILIARHSDSLLTAKNKLESEYNVHVDILRLDLEKENAADSIARWCTEKDIHLKVLCNVAGFGGARDYLSLPLDTLRYMVRLNVESCMALSLTLLPLLEKNAPSYILNVASMAGLAPIPVKNMYSATKSAVVFFSYSLRYQLKKKHISVSCLSPGPVFTKPEIEQDTKKKLGWFGVQMAVPQKKVGEIAVRKTLKGRMMIVPGTLSKITSFIIRILPRRWIVAIYSKVGNK
jgi:short-subunit dehydrogenase